MSRKMQKVLIGLGAAASCAAAVGVVSYNTTKKFVKIAMDREEPKAMQKEQERLSGELKNDEIQKDMELRRKKLENSGLEVVEIESHDNVKLIGHWYECENSKRTIIAMHGWRSSWSDGFALISDFWYKNGCNVLYAEQRGQGNSDGEYMGFGLLERFDCLDWIRWVNDRCENKKPVYLAGVSMGAATVLMAAGLELGENVCGIMADCGFTSPDAIWKHVAKNNLGLPYGGLTGTVASDICKKKIQIGSKDYSCTEALSHCKVPVLFIHGTDDRFVPIEMTYENYKACASKKRLLVVPGAGHGESYLFDRENYEKTVLDFWNDCEQKSEFTEGSSEITEEDGRNSESEV